MKAESAGRGSRAALLTGAGASAIAVARIDGPLVIPFLTAHFRGTPRLGRCVHGDLVDGDKTLDDPVVVLVNDDRADLNIHGGPWVVQSVLSLLGRYGFELMDPLAAQRRVDGDDSRSENWDDLLWDADSPIQRQILASLSDAKTELALRMLLAQPAAWTNLATWASTVDAPARQARLARMIEDRSLENLLRQPVVAIVGAPNVGKSTLANRLFGAERSITADLPGTTRDWVGASANIDGLVVMLVDTPGIRVTDDPIEREAIARGSVRITQADLVLLILDQTRPMDHEQAALAQRFPAALRVINKCDLPGAFESSEPALFISASQGIGIDAVRHHILRHFGCEKLDPTQAYCWTTTQRQLLARAIESPSALASQVRPTTDRSGL